MAFTANGLDTCRGVQPTGLKFRAVLKSGKIVTYQQEGGGGCLGEVGWCSCVDGFILLSPLEEVSHHHKSLSIYLLNSLEYFDLTCQCLCGLIALRDYVSLK